MKENTHTEDWQDMLELLVAAWIVFSPFALGFWHEPVATVAALVIGACAIFVSQIGLANRHSWEEWVMLILAVVLITSPWLFGYATVTAAAVCAVISGGLLIGLSLSAMASKYMEARPVRGLHS